MDESSQLRLFDDTEIFWSGVVLGVLAGAAVTVAVLGASE